MTKYLFTIFAVFCSIGAAFAQEVEMANTMRENGKIYVVVAVLAIIFIGISFYLISLDKKISNIEKKLEK